MNLGAIALAGLLSPGFAPLFSSKTGIESRVEFSARFHTNQKLENLRAMEPTDLKRFVDYEINPTLAFLFGPLTHREVGGPQKDHMVEILWDQSTQSETGTTLMYRYEGTWILNRNLASTPKFSLPLPLSEELLYTTQWKRCGDSAPDHQNRSYFWYYWDPERYGCDHKLNSHYQLVEVSQVAPTVMTDRSRPEFSRMIRQTDNKRTIKWTFAFGYADDKNQKNPFRDFDIGMQEFQDFLSFMRNTRTDWIESEVLLSEYPGYAEDPRRIGTRFKAKIQGAELTVDVVSNFKIDQMDLFAKSYAVDHDSFFSWFGHSRVGSGFDAESFRRKIRYQPNIYSLSEQYQLIYWGGCNSYSYYSLPFFGMKANAQDPLGIKNLDILVNGLPSYFHLNAENAELAWNTLSQGLIATLENPEVSAERLPTYQGWLEGIENVAARAGIIVLAAILGDEDNR